MQQMRAKRENTVRYIHMGYEYHIDTTSPNLYRCSTRTTTKCRGAAEVTGQPPHERVNVYMPHEGHQPNPTVIEEITMRYEMIDLAVETNDTLKSIFDTVCARNPEVAHRLLFPAMKSAMDRARRKIRPIIPADLHELAGVLDNYELTRNIYRGCVQAADDSVALIFISDTMLEALGTASEIYIDGTFKVAPYQPPIAQLYTIHLRIADTGIAAVFVLCSTRRRALYRAIFGRILQLAPGLGESLRFVMGDFERPAMSAIRDVYPRASIHGCWFHFNQAIARRWKRLGLANASTTILGLAMALPLAPAARFAEGLELLADLSDAIAHEFPAILQFMLYMRTQWGPLAAVVSVHNCPIRTNNLVESFHNDAKRKLGGLHPNIWKFIEHLTGVIVNQGIDLARANGGHRPRRSRALKNMARDTIIRDAQHDLSVNRLTLMEFLRRCATRVTVADRLEPERHAEEQEEAVDDDIVPLGLLLAAEDPQIQHELVRRGGRRGRGARPRNVQPEILPEEEGEQELRVPGRGRGRARGRARGGLRGRARGRGAGHLVQNEPALDDPAEPDDPEPVNRDNDPDVRRHDELVPAVPPALVPAAAQPPARPPVQPAEPAAAELEQPAAAAQPAAAPEPQAFGGDCCACMVVPATHAYVPCGHMCCCGACALRWPFTCPLCRNDSIGAYLIRPA